MSRARKHMFGPRRCVSLALAVCLLPFALAVAPAPAQQPPARDLPTPDQIEPGVNTSAPAARATQGSTAVSQSAAPKGSTAAKGSSTAPQGARQGSTAVNESAVAKGTPAKSSTAAKDSTAAPGAAPGAKPKGGKGTSRLELEATEITGNRELPKVLYIVPWKRSDLGELVGRPVNSLLDEVLAPIDRDVFQRENRYYNGLGAAPGAPAASPSPAAETKP